MGRPGANCTVGLSGGSSLIFVGREMISGSSALRADLKQQRMLNAAQENRLNVTLIWRLSRISKFVNPKDFEAFCREDGLGGGGNPQTRLEQYI